MPHATGPFEVQLAPQPADDAGGEGIGRLLLDKRFHGALAGTSRGQMLGYRNDAMRSAGYVAIERFDGTLDGRAGGFVLQHLGSMSRGAMSLDIRIVPDSGTGELEGIAGTMRIEIAPGGAHTYGLDYELRAGSAENADAPR